MQSEDQPPERENQPVDLLDEFGTGIWWGRRGPAIRSDHKIARFGNQGNSEETKITKAESQGKLHPCMGTLKER